MGWHIQEIYQAREYLELLGYTLRWGKPKQVETAYQPSV
jgi:hypothetical protein